MALNDNLSLQVYAPLVVALRNATDAGTCVLNPPPEIEYHLDAIAYITQGAL